MKSLFRIVAVGLTLLVAVPAPVQAESENPLWKWNKNKKKAKSVDAAYEQRLEEDNLPASQNWQNANSGGKATTISGVVTDDNVTPMLSQTGGLGLQRALHQYQEIARSGGWPSVPNEKLKKGSEGEAVALLNRRLFIEGYVRQEATEGEFATIFTSATAEALGRFQRNHGLKVSGTLDAPTVKALNVPATRRLATIRANVARLDEYAKDLGGRYIIVNIPAAQLETVTDGRVHSRHNIIVGRPSRPTPVVMAALSEINFNPYWNAPASIVERDIIPKMLKSGARNVLDQMNVRVFKGFGGPEIDPEDVDWEYAIADDYHFRQEPGGSNAMATAKINFPSPFGIYLHDTPEKHLFAAGARFFSSGCVRVEQVGIFLDWILAGQDYFDAESQQAIDRAKLEELSESLERLDVKLANPPQLRVTYLTAWSNGRGEVNFRPDIYALDGSGFVMGQPLPVGEVAEDGQRFVLKPVPRQPSAVEEAEADGFFLFNFRPSKRNVRRTEAVEEKQPATSNWLQSKPGKKKVKSAVKNDGKKKKIASQKKPATKKIIKQEEQAIVAKKVEPAPTPVKQMEPAAEKCKSAVVGALLEDCPPSRGSAAKSE